MEIIYKDFDYHVDLKAQRKLFIDCFPENLGSKVIEECHYMWKFQSFPSAMKRSYESVAVMNDDLVGYYAALPYEYDIAGKIYQVGMVCDVMTSSKCRGKGIFTKLGKYSINSMKEKGIPFTIGYPIRKEVMPGHLKVGWKVAFKQPLYMRFLSLRSLFRAKNKEFIAYFLDIFLFIYSLFTRSLNSDAYTVKIFHKIDDVHHYDELVKEWKKTVMNSLNKSLEFAKWRYGAPDKKYIYIGAYCKEKLVGFASVREIVKEGVPSLGILDFMVLPEYKRSLANIHNEILKIARDRKKEAIMTMMSPTSAHDYRMLRNGYIRSPFVFNVIINKLDQTLDDSILYNEKNWHLMFVDSDDL